MADMVLNAEEIDKLARKIENSRSSALQKMNALKSRVDSVKLDEWSGKQRDSFKKNFDDVYSRINNGLTPDTGAFSDMAEYLRKMKQISIEFENQQIGRSGNL